MLELNKLYNMDCMDGMAQFPDKYFDLAIVDPPYGIMETGGQSGGCVGHLKDRVFNKFMREGSVWDKKPDEEYFKELFRLSENQIIWGGNYFTLPPTRGIICWDKVQPWENFSAWEYGWTSFSKPSKIFKKDNRTGDKIHPTQKPIALYKWLLKNYAQEDFKIIDTHAGSCSSVIAFLDYGCDWIAFEIDEDYYKSANSRIENHKLQIRLF